jgi:hypothetical protein
MRKHIIQAIFLAFLISGCGVDAIGDDAVRVTTSNSAVTIINTTSHVVYYVLIEAETATLVDLAPMSEWPTIEPRSEITIQYVDIMGYSETATEAYFMWRTKKGPSGASMTIRL